MQLLWVVESDSGLIYIIRGQDGLSRSPYIHFGVIYVVLVVFSQVTTFSLILMI